MGTYTKMMYERNREKVSYGRIVTYNKARGFGFIRTEDGPDLFVSSHQISRRDEKHMTVGALVSYIVDEYKGRYVASHVTILVEFPCGKTIALPNGKLLQIKNIKTVGTKKIENQRDSYIQSIYFAMKGGDEFTVVADDFDTDPSKGREKLGEYWENIKKKLYVL